MSLRRWWSAGVAFAWAIGGAGCSEEPCFDKAECDGADGTATATTTGASGSTQSTVAQGPSSTSASSASGEGGGGGGVGGSGSGAGSSTGAGGGEPWPCDELHVSPNGDDEATGCGDTPLRTLRRAVEIASTAAIGEVRLCQGVFEGDVEISARDYRIEGGYSCTGFATKAEASVVEGDGTLAATLVIDAAVTVADLQVFGPIRSDGGSSVAIRIDGGDPVVSNVEATGGDTTVELGIASIGLWIAGGSPRFDGVARGGNGIAEAGFGSAGAYVEGASPVLVGTFDGGAGSGGTPTSTGTVVGSVGLVLVAATLVGDSALVGVDIDGGTGTTEGAVGTTEVPTGPFTPSAGIIAQDSTLHLSESFVTAGSGRGPTHEGCNVTVVNSFAISAGLSDLTVETSRIWGGSGDFGRSLAAYGGIQVSVGALDVSDSVIVAGSPQGDASCYQSARAISPVDAATTVRNSTLVALSDGASTAGIWAGGGAAMTLALRSNLVVSMAEGSSFGVAWTGPLDPDGTSCASPKTITELTNNAWYVGSHYFGCGNSELFLSSTGLFEERVLCLNPAVEMSGNFEVGPVCDGTIECYVDSDCAHASASACLAELFGSAFDDGGLGELVEDGLGLADSVLCAVAQNGREGGESDALGAPRTEPPSIGGREYDGSCSPIDPTIEPTSAGAGAGGGDCDIGGP